MFRNLLLTVAIVLFANLLVYSQSGALKGKIIDAETKEPIPFANIVLELGGTQVGGASSDFDGNYQIKPIEPGKYDLKCTYVGYQTQIVQGIIIKSEQTRFFDVELKSAGVNLDVVEVVDYAVPLIDKDKTVTGKTVTAEEIAKLPQRSAGAVASTVGGVFSRDGEAGNIRGARSDGTVTYIDGMRVVGSAALPQSAIEQVAVMLGGLPAQYGDATGGVISVTTKGPSRQFGAGLELETSQFLDAFGSNRLGFSVNGPLFRKKDAEGKKGDALLGFFLAGDANYRQDGRPLGPGIYKGTDETIAFLEANPLRPAGVLGGGTFKNGEFLRMEDLEHSPNTQNTSRYSVNLSGKIDVKTSKNTNLSFGGQFVFNKSNNFSYAGSLINFNKNSVNQNRTYRVFGQFTQRFPSSKEQGKKSLISNVYYRIQADYSNVTNENYDPDHKQNYFNYGYLGKFTEYKTGNYTLGSDTVDGQIYDNVWLLENMNFDTLLTFDPKNYNPLTNEWTNYVYEYAAENGFDIINRDQLQLLNGKLNGQGPENIYGLYSSPGTIMTGYGKSMTEQFSINANAAADIGDHEIKFGFQYEQRIGRSYNVGPQGLWAHMRGLANFHILEMDRENAMPVYNNGVFMDTINYFRKYDAASQRVFDANLRQKLGLPVDGTDYIVIDSYDMDNYTIDYYDQYGKMHSIQLSEDIFNIDMFSPDELLNDGNSYAFWRGYDHTGKKLKNKPTWGDFFNKTDENGVFLREMGAYEPIYMAGYIQDKFSFKDLIFNIGVRIDRFDANQPVLKDPYTLFPAYTVQEVNDINGVNVSHPGNVGEDYVVYVDNARNPTRVVGYRDENTWYNAEGQVIQDPNLLDVGGGVSPFIKDPTQERVNEDSFKDYEPQINIMPRISFSFPISEDALFFAHYDVLTQRPTNNVAASPATYWNFNQVAGYIANPALNPRQTIEYELGFQQRLSLSSSITISGFYREMRDDIQAFRYNGAYPKTYTSYSNYDFGTVKGITVEYDLRRTNNARVRASYTLQFTESTGASPTSAAALIAAQLPNLRTTQPTPWDRRHNITLLLDYRYKQGKDYNGPLIHNKKKGTTTELLRNTGMALTMTGGSGTPYTAQREVTSPITGGNRLVKGSYYGSRLPWQFRLDLRVDKDIFFTPKTEEGRAIYMNVYLQVLNLLDTKNVVGVYPATGNPDDDGYLASPKFQTEIESQIDPQSFRDLYGIYVDNPFNYSSPRQIRIGLIFNF